MTDRPIDLPAGYSDWLADRKVRIRGTRLRASLAMSAELTGLSWRIGRDILDRPGATKIGRQDDGSAGPRFRDAFPQSRGFSRANLLYMRAVAEAWPDPKIVQRIVGRLPSGQNSLRLSV